MKNFFFNFRNKSIFFLQILAIKNFVYEIFVILVENFEKTVHFLLQIPELTFYRLLMTKYLNP